MMYAGASSRVAMGLYSLRVGMEQLTRLFQSAVAHGPSRDSRTYSLAFFGCGGGRITGTAATCGLSSNCNVRALHDH